MTRKNNMISSKTNNVYSFIECDDFHSKVVVFNYFGPGGLCKVCLSKALSLIDKEEE